MLKKLAVILFSSIFCLNYAQNLSNYRLVKKLIVNDTLTFDSLSIVPTSFQLLNENNQTIDANLYHLDALNAQLIVNASLLNKTLTLQYRTYPYLFSKKYFHRSFESYKETTEKQGFIISSAKTTEPSSTTSLINFGKLDYNGNLSRGFGFGNAQSLNINSSFNIQLSGMITDDIEVKASITDNNIPIQAEGNTAQLQEFDKVFIQLRKDQHFVTVGDFDLQNRPGYFMKFQRNLQGVSYTGTQDIKDIGTVNGMASFAISRGKFVINNLVAQEGNQGPYRLTGPNGETFIIVLSGSERVFINGVQQARGDNNDYVIDYNLGTISFTPKKMITQDMRIRVEFEYADRYYLRSLYHVNGGFEQKKFIGEFQFFSQQDAKNQAINQDLNDDKITALENAGDNVNEAFASGINLVDFDASRVLYEAKDTLINSLLDTFYVYSQRNDVPLYSLTFSFVGANQGSYEPISAVANGRVFAYQGPNLGSFEPVIKLIAPEKQQMLSSRFTYKMTEKSRMGVEFALSNQDINTFSEINNNDNVGVGLHAFFQQQQVLKKDSSKSIQLTANYEFKQDQFTPLERYRAVEFNRNFNLQDNFQVNEHLSSASVQFTKKNKGNIRYQINYLNREAIYQGVENSLQSSYTFKGVESTNSIQYLLAKSGNLQTHFIRPNLLLAKSFDKLAGWKTGITLNNEINKVNNTLNDSLVATSFLWQEYGVFIQNPDSVKNQYSFSYKLRYQHLSNGENFDKAYLKAHNIELKGRFLAKKNHTLHWNAIYRNLQQDTLFSADSNLEHFYLGRIDYGLVAYKGAIKANTLYELGAGREQKIQYNYIEDPNGQGSYAWEDINDNGVQEINEFYVSAFPNENRFIRIYTNSLEFQPVNATRFNQSLHLNPKAVWFSEKGIKNFVARFSSTTALQFSKKVFASADVNFAQILSPFTFSVNDSVLVSNNTNIRNVIFFNRSSTVYGFDYSYQYSVNKTLLTSGFEIRKFILNTFSGRWNFAENFTLNAQYSTGFKQNDSDFFFDRRYEYILNEVGGDVTWLYKNLFRIELGYDYSFKSNPLPIYGGQFAVSNQINTTLKYAKPNNYSITSQFAYTSVGYNDDSFENQQLAFDMLQGLQAGNNFVWNVGVDKTFAKLLQVSAQYDGRKTGPNPLVHGGRMQVRAIF